jgi:hypothetical protein
MNQNINMESEAHVYVDVNLPQIGRSPSSNEDSKLAIYESTNTSAILANSEDYHLIIERWSIPGFLLPSFIFPDPTEDQLSVQLRYNGEIVEEDVIFTSLSPLSPSSEEYYYVYEYQHLIDMINTALQTAHTNLTTKPVGSLPPFITYDETGRFRVYGEQAYYDTNLATPIEVLVSAEIWRVMPFIEYDTNTNTNNDYWQVLIKDNKNNRETIDSVDYYYSRQQADGSSYINPVQKIIFTTNSIPIRSTYTNINDSNTVTSNSNSFPILSDFIIDDLQGLDHRKQLVYEARDYNRRIDLLGKQPLYTISITAYWLDYRNRLKVIRIPNNDFANIKLLFMKKTTLH